MKTDDIYPTLTGVFHDVFDDESIEVTPELTASDVADWDSLTHIRLMLTIEKVFNVKFTASEVGHLKNVGELVSLIRTKTAQSLVTK